MKERKCNPSCAKIALTLALSFLSPLVLAHGGGLDAAGCHHNRKTGDYHCHRTPSAPKKDPPSKVQKSGDPTCYVGPRGGTYTITPSGKKNYNGC
jgi:hypothetical protein